MSEGIGEAGDCIIEMTSQSEIPGTGGKVAHRLSKKAASCVGLAKATSQCKVRDLWGEDIDRLVEVGTQCQASDTGGEVVDWLAEIVSK